MDAPQRAGQLIAERRGGEGPTVLLIAHLDTVFEPAHPFQGVEHLEEGRLRGPGVIDDKGGVVVILHALEALHHAGALAGANVIVYLGGDEELPGEPLEAARAPLVEAARRSDAALGFEPGSAVHPDQVVVARRGFSAWSLTVEAATGHSSRVGSEVLGYGAVYEAARILGEVRGLLDEPYLTLNPGMITGGTEAALDVEAAASSASGKRNVIAARAEAYGDLRFIDEAQRERAREAMRAIAAAPLPGASAAFTFEDGYPAMSPTEGNRALLATLDAASRDLGLGGVEGMDPGLRGAADVSFVAPYVPCLDGLGLRGVGAHAAGEVGDLGSLTPTAQRAAALIYRLTR